MRCAVFNCDNNNNKNNESSIRFYCFPKDKVLRKQWVHFCRRKDQFNVKTSRICCAHFAPDDIERNLQFEMGLCQKNGYKLKPGTIPTLLNCCLDWSRSIAGTIITFYVMAWINWYFFYTSNYD